MICIKSEDCRFGFFHVTIASWFPSFITHYGIDLHARMFIMAGIVFVGTQEIPC